MDSPEPAAPAPASTAPTRPPQLRIEMGGAGWVLLVAGLLGIYLLLKLTWPLLSGEAKPQPLAPKTPEELGFDLSNCNIPREQIIVGAPADSIPPLMMPKTVAGKDAAAITKEYRRKYHHKFVVDGDRVIGVTINGESRAYQLKIMQWHEVASDVLGGVPIAVTYCPLTDSVVVFDPRVRGQLRSFRSSGLLYNNNSLLSDHDPRAIADNSKANLWSQLGLRAVAGPIAANANHYGGDRGRLKSIPCELTHWGDWLARHPDTTLLSDQTGHDRAYTKNAYGAYFDRMKLRFPVQPAPSGNEAQQFTRMVAVQQPGGSWQAWDYPTLKAQPQQGDLRFVYEPVAPGLEPDTVRLEGNTDIPVVYGLRFALEAFGFME